MVDKKTTDKKPVAKATTSADADKKANTKNVSAKKEAKTTVTKAAAKAVTPKATPKAATKAPAPKATAKVEAKAATPKDAAKAAAKVATPKDAPKVASAATAKAGALKESDMKSAAKKISEVDKQTANNAIKSKKSVDDLKTRAHEAKQRAQKKILEKAYVSDKPADPLERLANTFDSSARRWEMVVYPSLFAFVLLAGYGFFLIYRLTHDIATMSQSVTHMAVIVSDAMPRMSRDLNMMTNSMDNMTGNIANMSDDVGGMTTEMTSMSGQMNSLTPMSQNIQSMTHNIGNMNRSVYGMQRDMHGMNRTVSSGPFGMMNDVMPFTSDTNVPPSVAPGQTWPSYNPIPQRNYVQRTAPTYRVPASSANRAKKTAAKPVVRPGNVKTEVTMPGASPVIIKETAVKVIPVKK